MSRDPLMVNKDEIADYKWVCGEEFVAIMKRKMSYLRAVSTLFPSYLLAKNSFENTKETGSQKTQSEVEVRVQSC